MSYRIIFWFAVCCCWWAAACGGSKDEQLTFICMNEAVYSYEGDVFKDIYQAVSDQDLERIASKLIYEHGCIYNCTEDMTGCSLFSNCRKEYRCYDGEIFIEEFCPDETRAKMTWVKSCPLGACKDIAFCLGCVCGCTPWDLDCSCSDPDC